MRTRLDYINERRDEARNRLGGRCVSCGGTENLEFDHVDPKTKVETISNLWTAAKEVFEKELTKCQLLCKPCHLIKTKEDLDSKLVHGTIGTYTNRRCRCTECVTTWNKYCRDRKRNKKLTSP